MMGPGGPGSPGGPAMLCPSWPVSPCMKQITCTLQMALSQVRYTKDLGIIKARHPWTLHHNYGNYIDIDTLLYKSNPCWMQWNLWYATISSSYFTCIYACGLSHWVMSAPWYSTGKWVKNSELWESLKERSVSHSAPYLWPWDSFISFHSLMKSKEQASQFLFFLGIYSVKIEVRTAQ